MSVINLTKKVFGERIADIQAGEWKFLGDKPAIIDFFATWCGPCKAMAPVLDGIAEKYAGKIDVYKVDVDQEQELASVFGIRAVPTFLFAPVSGTPSLYPGMLHREDMEKIVEDLLSKK